MLWALLACAVAVPPPPPSSATSIAVVGARVFDGERVLADATVLISGDHIVAVGAGLEPPPDSQVVDGRGRTLLPGLIDAHTHCRGIETLAQAAVFGVTTEIDLMCDPEWVARLKRAANEAPIADLRSSGNPVAVPGGHGTQYGRAIPTLERVEDSEAFVAARVAEGADFVKLLIEDGTAGGRPWPSLTDEQVERAIAAAHANQKLAVAHVTNARQARVALEAGADVLAHLYGGGAHPDLVALAAAKGASVTPTLSVLHAMCEPEVAGGPVADDPLLRPYLPAEVASQLRSGFGRGRGSCAEYDAGVAALRGAGVRILAGSDAPNPGTAHGATLHGELALLVSAGLTPTEALVAATSAPAAAFGLADRGRIAAGMRADLLLVEGDPTADVTATRAIVGVWVRGLRVERPLAPVPARAGGRVSDFDDGTTAARFGADWTATTDGVSIAKISPAGGALAIDGEVRPSQGLWAGAWFQPGATPTTPVDLSGPDATVSLRVRGDPGTYAVMLFSTGSRFGALREIEVGPQWRTVRLPFVDFGVGGTDLRGLFIGSKRVGRFHLEIDDVSLGVPALGGDEPDSVP